MSTKSKIVTFLLTITIFYQVFYTSSWQLVYVASLWKYLGYGIYFLLLFVVVVGLFSMKILGKKLLFLLFCLIIFAFYIYKGNIQSAVLFLICATTVFMDTKDLLKSYFWGIGGASVIVLIFSLLGLLPRTNEMGLLSFGFKNPNVLGFYMLVLFLIYLCLRKSELKLIPFIIFLALSFFVGRILEDATVVSALFLTIIFYLISSVGKKIMRAWLIKWLIIIFPFILTILTFWIGKNYYTYYWMSELNDVFTSRPMIWNFYLSNFRLTLGGIQLPENILFGRGAFDGAFIYFPMLNGVLFFAIMLFFIYKGLRYVTRNKMYLEAVMITILLITAFSENTAFIALQSPLLPLCTLFMVSSSVHQTKPEEIEGVI